MNKRLAAAVAAGMLALVGVLVLVSWAKGANERAYEGADLVSVVRVTEPVAAGTKADVLQESTEIAKLPKDAVPAGALRSLAEVKGLTTTTTLEKGEVLLAARLAAPGAPAQDKATVPKGYQEISVSLEAQRVVGGAVRAGDKVGVIATFRSENAELREFGNLVRHDVVVTKVDTATVDGVGAASMVTLAVQTQDAEKIAFAQDFGKVWLTKQNSDTDRTGEKLITGKDFLR